MIKEESDFQIGVKEYIKPMIHIVEFKVEFGFATSWDGVGTDPFTIDSPYEW